MLKFHDESHTNANLTCQSVILSLYSTRILLNIIISSYNIDIIWNIQSIIISMTWGSSSSLQEDDPWAFMFTYIMWLSRLISMYYYILYKYHSYQYHIPLLILKSTLVFLSSIVTCVNNAHNMSVSCNGWLIIDYIMILINKSINFHFNSCTHVSISLMMHNLDGRWTHDRFMMKNRLTWISLVLSWNMVKWREIQCISILFEDMTQSVFGERSQIGVVLVLVHELREITYMQ